MGNRNVQIQEENKQGIKSAIIVYRIVVRLKYFSPFTTFDLLELHRLHLSFPHFASKDHSGQPRPFRI